jgi:DNA-binding transcriptional LysR family regulator
MAVVPRNHALSARKVLRWSDLADQIVISTWKGAGVRMVMDVDLARVRSPVKPFFEVQQMYTALRFVEEGLGIAPVPAFFLGQREYQSLCVLPLTDPIISVDLGSVVSRNHPLRSTAREALAILEQVCRTHHELTRVDATHFAGSKSQN